MSIAGRQWCDTVDRIFDRADRLPIVFCGNAEAANIALDLDHEPVAEIICGNGADNRVDPGLAAAALSHSERADKNTVRAEIPQPSARQQIKRQAIVVDK